MKDLNPTSCHTALTCSRTRLGGIDNKMSFYLKKMYISLICYYLETMMRPKGVAYLSVRHLGECHVV